MSTRTLTAVLHKEEAMYVVECPELRKVSGEEAIRVLTRLGFDAS